MSIWWTDIKQWFDEEAAAIAQEYDSVTLWTGEEGVGKSETMVAVNYVKSKEVFCLDDIHFDEDEGMAYCTSREPGACVQFDEVDGHRRLAMTKKRMRLLKFLKERRSLRLRLSIAFPHVDQLERDILNSRIRYWVHVSERTETRTLILVHRRRARLVNRPGEPPKKVVDFPLVGRFWIDKPHGPLIVSYRKKKWNYTHRDDDILEDLAPERRINIEAAKPVVDRIRAAMPVAAALGPPPPANQVFLDQVLGELKRSP